MPNKKPPMKIFSKSSNPTFFFFFSLAAIIIVFSPYTIVRLTSWAEEETVITEENEYQALETQLAELADQEAVLENELAAMETVAGTTTENPTVLIEENTPLPSIEVTPLPVEPATIESLPIEEEIEEEAKTNPQSISPQPNPEPAFDPAIAPGTVAFQLKAQTGVKVKFPLKVKLIGVGREPIIVSSDSQGRVELELESGRYYGEIVGDDFQFASPGPAFFLSANSQVDLGEHFLIKK